MGNTNNALNLPGSDILFARLAQSLMESGDVAEAIEICEKGVRKFPTYAQAHYILAKGYMKQHMTDEARIELERVLRYDPNHANAIKDLSSIYFINGFQDLYREYLLKLFVLCPLNEEIVDEVKKLGDFDLWSPVSVEKVKIQTRGVTRPAPEEARTSRQKVEPVTEELIKPDADPVFSKKVDLSQFDNLQDDFTTILHGNLELPGKKTQVDADDIDLIKNREEIFAEEELLIEDPVIDPAEEMMDELLGDDEELVIKNSNQIAEPAEEAGEPEIIITRDHERKPKSETTDSAKRTAALKIEESEKKIPVKEEATEPIDVKEMPKSVEKTTETPVSDFDHLQDDEEGRFEQPKIISQTLGEILVSQKKFAEAKSVFEALKEKHPQNKSLDVKIAYLNKIIGLEK